MFATGPAIFCPVPAPPYKNFGYLLHNDGIANPQSFPDVLPNTWTRGALSDPANLSKLLISNTQAKFGAGALEVATVGGSTDFTISGVPNSGTYTLQTGNQFTLQAWVWWTGNVDSRISAGGVQTTGGAMLAEIRAFGANNFTFNTILATSDARVVAMPLNQWAHVAMSYDGTTKYWFLNGVLQGTAALSPGAAAPITGYKSFGVPSGNASAPSGFIDEMAFEFDYCRWNASFVPPTDPY